MLQDDESTQKPSAKRGGWGTDAELGYFIHY